jgi:hypothetical protein
LLKALWPALRPMVEGVGCGSGDGPAVPLGTLAGIRPAPG